MILSESTAPPYHYSRGHSPLIVSMPHVGTYVPPSIARGLSDCAARRDDTDWHLPRLYDFLGALDATVITASYSRYVVDLNRPPNDANLYPGQDTTGLCPVDTFARESLYVAAGPNAESVARRVDRYWRPFHRRIATEIARVRGMHDRVVLWDAHSIASEVPRFFSGRLPDFNLGTAAGASCSPDLAKRLLDAVLKHTGYDAVLDGRFQGGYITRQYGKPAQGVHAVQLEMGGATYLDSRCPFPLREDLAARVRPILREQLDITLDWASP